MTAALRYEVARLRTLRSTWWLLGVSIVVAAGIGMIVAWAATANDLGDNGLAIALSAGGEFSPVPLPPVLAGLVGVFALGHEYRYGTIRPALSAVPQRSSLMLAKVVVTGVWTAIVGVALVAVAYLVLLVFPGQNVAANGIPWDPAGRVALGFVVLMVLWALVGLGLAGLTRNLPAAIVLLLVIPLVVEGILFAVLNFVPALADISWLTKYLPFGAGQAMLTTFSPGELGGPEFEAATPLEGGIIFAIFTAVLLGVTWVLFERKDA